MTGLRGANFESSRMRKSRACRQSAGDCCERAKRASPSDSDSISTRCREHVTTSCLCGTLEFAIVVEALSPNWPRMIRTTRLAVQGAHSLTAR